MQNKHPPIVLLTDFGAQDPFVGVMKGVIQAILPGAALIDLTHAVPRGDILQAAVFLWQSVSFFPPGTVYLCVIDPGVGTDRAGIMLQTERGRFIGPDNGLFSFISSRSDPAWRLENPDFRLPQQSSTFHGRDIFAPAAAHAARGAPGSDFGRQQPERVELKKPRLETVTQNSWAGEVLFADRFGNILTSLGQFQAGEHSLRLRPWLRTDQPALDIAYTHEGGPGVRLEDGRLLPLVSTFAYIPADECGCLIGSSGLIEIAANRRSALDILKLERYDPLIFEI